VSIRIRPFRAADAAVVGRLIADTFREFNLSYAPAEEQEMLLGPFRHARSRSAARRAEISRLIRAPWVLVAVSDDRIVGVLRGSPGRLHSLFVQKRVQGRGIGRRLMKAFERRCRKAGATEITMQSSLYAVPFYQRLGYRRTTGVRRGRCFDGDGFPYQPMKKRLVA
jgi:GNAT superfamily N-acetyltransferase